MIWRKKNGKNDDDTYRTIFFITSILNYIAWQNEKSRAWSLLHLNVYLKDFLFVASLLSSYVQCKKFCNICWDLRHKVDFFYFEIAVLIYKSRHTIIVDKEKCFLKANLVYPVFSPNPFFIDFLRSNNFYQLYCYKYIMVVSYIIYNIWKKTQEKNEKKEKKNLHVK